jgi:hypothetical protein
MKTRVRKKRNWLFWTPRILSILFILFLALFSLDIFDGNYGFWGTILGLFMHNLPSIILTILLIIFWNRGIVPGVVFILGGLAYVAMMLTSISMDGSFEWYTLSWSVIISGPAFVIGILFIIDWIKRKGK